MSYRAPRDLALDLALTTLLETQVREGHYASVEEFPCSAIVLSVNIQPRDHLCAGDDVAKMMLP